MKSFTIQIVHRNVLNSLSFLCLFRCSASFTPIVCTQFAQCHPSTPPPPKPPPVAVNSETVAHSRVVMVPEDRIARMNGTCLTDHLDWIMAWTWVVHSSLKVILHISRDDMICPVLFIRMICQIAWSHVIGRFWCHICGVTKIVWTKNEEDEEWEIKRMFIMFHLKHFLLDAKFSSSTHSLSFIHRDGKQHFVAIISRGLSLLNRYLGSSFRFSTSLIVICMLLFHFHRYTVHLVWFSYFQESDNNDLGK